MFGWSGLETGCRCGGDMLLLYSDNAYADVLLGIVEVYIEH
jgi:hypothetical protein